jgi:hypothetical protein
MPIVREIISEMHDVPVAEFGTGDIVLCLRKCVLIEDNSVKYYSLWLRQQEEMPLEKWTKSEEIPEPNKFAETIILRFKKKESVEQVIKQLTKIKELM